MCIAWKMFLNNKTKSKRHVHTQHDGNLWSQKAMLCNHSFFCERNGLAEVEENNSDVNPAFDDDAQKVTVLERYGCSWNQIELDRIG